MLRTCSILFVLLLALCQVLCVQKTLDNQEWEDLENLLQNVDQVGVTERSAVSGEEDPNDESMLLFNHQHETPESTTTEDTISLGDNKNPCQNHLCGWGKECLVAKNRPRCECVKRCPDVSPFDSNDRVCSSQNHTFDSICHLYRERCLCKKTDVMCTDSNFINLHLEYLGACKELQPCTQEHLTQFSERMNDWLFQVMKDLKKRQELHGEKWIHMIEEAEHDDHLKHVYPVIWKYCDLDRKPHDKAVTHQELIPIIAPVMPMESCIKPFLKSCDTDKDDLISLKEWGKCLGLHEEEITERC